MSAGRMICSLERVRLSRGVWGVVLVGALASGAWVTHAADEGATGLRGVLPAEVPSGLTAAIAALPETWQPWGEGLTADLATLYEKEGLDVAGQRKAIGALDTRLKTVASSLADPKYKSISSQLVSLHGGLKRRLDLAKAAIDTLEMGPEIKAARIEATRKDALNALTTLEKDLRSIKGGEAWLKYLQVAETRTQLGSKSVATVAAVRDRLKGQVTQADAKIRTFLDRPSITVYDQALAAYDGAVANAAPTANSPALRKSLGELLAGVEDYELSHATDAAAAVRKAFDAVRGAAPDGGERIALAVRSNYFNYNLRVIATEAFVNRLAAQRRQESGAVRDYILGADVYGNQTTATTVSLDLVPNATAAQFDIVANGAISSSTVGVTDQAQIYTQGNHHFTAAKRISFNGDKFSTQPARINVSANNTTTGADTNFGIFSPIANRIAVGKAEEMRGESEAIAASRVQSNVIPKFNSEVDKEFGPNGSFNPKLSERFAALRELELYPDAKSWSTTDTELRMTSRLMTASELGGNDPHPALVLGRGATILVHETLMNNAADRLDLKGQTLTDDQLKGRIEQNLTKLLGREYKFKDDKPADAEESSKSLAFAQKDPIRFQVGDGTLVVTLRAGLKQEGKEEIPTQTITIPLRFSVDVKNVVIEPGSVSVSPVDKPDSAATQIARAGVIKKKIEAAFPRREIERVATVERHESKARIAVTRIKALDGWLSLTFE
jgi:hypothetical protein